MGLGRWRGLQAKNEVKLTGILYSNNPHIYNTKQYHDILQHTDNTIHMYKHISHTIFGRSIIINTFILPKLLYISTVCEPPPNFISKIQKKLRSFIFKSTLQNIQHNTLIQTKSVGGIALQDFTSKIQALRLKYLDKLPKHHTYTLSLSIYTASDSLDLSHSTTVHPTSLAPSPLPSSDPLHAFYQTTNTSYMTKLKSFTQHSLHVRKKNPIHQN